MLKQLFTPLGEPVPEMPRARDVDTLEWLIPQLAHVGIRQLAKYKWVAKIETHRSDSGETPIICGLSPYAIQPEGAGPHQASESPTTH